MVSKKVKKKEKKTVLKKNYKRRLTDRDSYPSFVFLILLAVFVYISYNVVYPFINAILSGVLLAFAIYPVYDFAKKFIPNETWRALIITTFLFLVLTLPFVYVLSNVTRQSIFEESNEVYKSIKKRIITGNVFWINCEEDSSFSCKLNNNLKEWLRVEKVKNYLTNVAEQVINNITSILIDLLLSIPSLLFNLIISILATFYFLRDGKYLSERLIKLLPLRGHHRKELFNKAYNVTYAVVYGTLLVALIQAVYAGIGFTILRFPNALFLSVLIGFAALIPYLGAWIIWFPTILYYIIVQIAAGNIAISYWVILVIFASSISLIDNFVKPLIIGSTAKVNTLLIFIGVIGGLMFFGILGFIFGPIVLGLTQVLLEMYEEERYCEK